MCVGGGLGGEGVQSRRPQEAGGPPRALSVASLVLLALFVLQALISSRLFSISPLSVAFSLSEVFSYEKTSLISFL